MRFRTDHRSLDGTSPANGAHAVWSTDGRSIYFTSGMYGFKHEAARYDDTFQPYGQIVAMDPDGGNKRVLIDSPREDGEPLFISRRLWTAPSAAPAAQKA